MTPGNCGADKGVMIVKAFRRAGPLVAAVALAGAAVGLAAQPAVAAAPVWTCTGEGILNLTSYTVTSPPLGLADNVTVTGTLSEPIVEGAYAVVQVKYGLIRLINTKEDMAEAVERAGGSLPIPAGATTFTADWFALDLDPAPPGTYTTFIDAYNVDNQPIYLCEGVQTFP